MLSSTYLLDVNSSKSSIFQGNKAGRQNLTVDLVHPTVHA